MTTLKDSFQRDLAVVFWRELRIHSRRDALVTVARELDLINVATAVAADAAADVAGWIDKGQLGKPTVAQLQTWENHLSKRFRMLIVQPYILIQETSDD